MMAEFLCLHLCRVLSLELLAGFLLKNLNNSFLRVLEFANWVFNKMEAFAESKGESTPGSSLSQRKWINVDKCKKRI